MSCKLLVSCLLLPLSGCGTAQYFQNRLLFTADCKEVRVCSEYGPLCIGSKIAASDAAAVLAARCK